MRTILVTGAAGFIGANFVRMLMRRREPVKLIALDKLNPQTAARLVPPLGRWKRFDEGRAALMRAELQRILLQPGLSKDVTEQVSKSLE